MGGWLLPDQVFKLRMPAYVAGDEGADRPHRLPSVTHVLEGLPGEKTSQTASLISRVYLRMDKDLVIPLDSVIDKAGNPIPNAHLIALTARVVHDRGVRLGLLSQELAPQERLSGTVPKSDRFTPPCGS